MPDLNRSRPSPPISTNGNFRVVKSLWYRANIAPDLLGFPLARQTPRVNPACTTNRVDLPALTCVVTATTLGAAQIFLPPNTQCLQISVEYQRLMIVSGFQFKLLTEDSQQIGGLINMAGL